MIYHLKKHEKFRIFFKISETHLTKNSNTFIQKRKSNDSHTGICIRNILGLIWAAKS